MMLHGSASANACPRATAEFSDQESWAFGKGALGTKEDNEAMHANVLLISPRLGDRDLVDLVNDLSCAWDPPL